MLSESGRAEVADAAAEEQSGRALRSADVAHTHGQPQSVRIRIEHPQPGNGLTATQTRQRALLIFRCFLADKPNASSSDRSFAEATKLFFSLDAQDAKEQTDQLLECICPAIHAGLVKDTAGSKRLERLNQPA